MLGTVNIDDKNLYCKDKYIRADYVPNKVSFMERDPDKDTGISLGEETVIPVEDTIPKVIHREYILDLVMIY